MTDSRLYNIWHNMRSRCEDSKNDKYEYYGGRGIKICKAWRDSATFIEWAVASGYEEHLTIDREDNNGDYEPSNCRWAPKSIQSINKKSRTNQHGFPGIAKVKGRFYPRITYYGKAKNLGGYDTPEEAYAVYKKAKEERDAQYLKDLETNKNK